MILIHSICMLEGNEDLLRFLKGEHVCFFCLYTAKGIILHSLFILILYILSSDAFEMNLPLDHTDPPPLSGLSIVSSEYDFSWVCCMEVKRRAIKTLSENSPLCLLVVGFWPQEPFFLRNWSSDREDSGSCTSGRSDCRSVIRQCWKNWCNIQTCMFDDLRNSWQS